MDKAFGDEPLAAPVAAAWQPRLIMKQAPEVDLYIGWSTMCEAPALIGTRAELLDFGIPAERLDRADQKGTSFIDSEIGAWDDPSLIAEQRGLLPRRHLGEYARRWLAGEHQRAFDLLEPIEGGGEVRRG